MKTIAACCIALVMSTFPTRASAEETTYEPIDSVTVAAKGGDKLAVHQLCYRYIYGKGVDQDYEKSLVWCSRGAALGVDSSQTLLAEMFLNGEGVSANFQAARFWYQEASNQDHPHALLMMFLIYDRGLGVGIDKAKADAFLKKSADAGHAPAVKVRAERKAN